MKFIFLIILEIREIISFYGRPTVNRVIQLAKKTRVFYGFIFLLTLLSSCEASEMNSLERVSIRIFAPIIILAILAPLLQRFFKKSKSDKRKSVNDYIDNLRQNQIINENKDSSQVIAPLEFQYVVGNIGFVYASGCLVIGIGLFISWFLFWIGIINGNKTFIYIFFFFLASTFIWLSLKSLIRKQVKVHVQILKDSLVISNFEKTLSLTYFPHEINRLLFYETTVRNKSGFDQTTGSFIKLIFNPDSGLTPIENKNDKFHELVGRYKPLTTENHHLQWNERNIFGSDPIYVNGKSLKSELIKFCVRNNIQIKNEI